VTSRQRRRHGRGTAESSHRRALYTGGGAGLAVIASVVIALATTAHGAGDAAPAKLRPVTLLPVKLPPVKLSPVTLTSAPLGLNVGPWDGVYAANTSTSSGMQSMLKDAGIGQFRYGGGSFSDYYDWQTNTDAAKCLPVVTPASFTSSCASTDPLGFSQFSQQARAIDANSFVTVNYGSGTPAEAAAWVTQAKDTPGEGVALWEVGNENYGCWEINDELATAPTNYQGYRLAGSSSDGTPSEPNCPQRTEGEAAGTQTLATSYAAHAKLFLQAMKAADPSAEIGVPIALGQTVPGSNVPYNSEWNKTVLPAVAKDISFVDLHYYPFWIGGPSTYPTDQQILQALRQIPAVNAYARAQLKTYAPNASVVVGETALSNNPTVSTCAPVGALFAAGDALGWLAAGAKSVDWFELNSSANGGSSCGKPDYGFFTSSLPTATETPYYGYLLASILAKPNAKLAALGTDSSDIVAYQSALPGGKHALAFINTNTSSARTVTFRPSPALTGTLNTWSYKAKGQNSTNSSIVTGTTSAAAIAHGITLPPESMTVLETQ
jgi:hypothetical protein